MTQLIGSPRISLLKEAHADDITADVTERVWALWGQTVHKIIEDGAKGLSDYIPEERLFLEVQGWMISGGVDIQRHRNGAVALIDWKTTSAYAVMQEKEEWANQLNSYAFLVEQTKGVTVDGLQIGAIIRDWSKREADRNPNYPQAPVVMIDIPLWSPEEQEVYVLERVALHQESVRQDAWGEEPPACTAEEMWERPSAWAVIKRGLRRATKVCDTEAEAVELADKLGASVEHRPGERIRCENYCEVSAWCSQFRVYKERLNAVPSEEI